MTERPSNLFSQETLDANSRPDASAHTLKLEGLFLGRALTCPRTWLGDGITPLMRRSAQAKSRAADSSEKSASDVSFWERSSSTLASDLRDEARWISAAFLQFAVKLRLQSDVAVASS